MASGQDPPTMVIAIDLGNISSGVAWAMLNAPNSEPKFVTGWETLSGNPSDDVKVPSTLYYGEAKNRNNPKWGFKVPDDPDVLRWFKHLIVDDKDLPDHIRFSPQLANAKRIMRKVQKTPVEIVGDYLKKLWLYSWEHISQSEGLGENPVINVLICITSPATWPSSARVRTTKALAHAGLLNYFPRDRFRLRFFTDISMAAFAAIDDHAERRDLEYGDVIIACDAGGGTVDVIPYFVTSRVPFIMTEYTKANGKLPLHMSHTRTNVVTAGEMCGAIFLSDKFSARVKKKGISPEIRQRVRDHALSKAIDHAWRSDISPFVHEENVKRFDVEIPLNLGTVADRKISISIPIGVLIILTGGFGLSPYLHKILVDRIPDVKLIMEAGQGACTKALEGSIKQGCRVLNNVTLEFPWPDIHSFQPYGTFASTIYDPHGSCSSVQPFRLTGGPNNFFHGENPIWFIQKGHTPPTSFSHTYDLCQRLVSPAICIHVPIMISFHDVKSHSPEDYVHHFTVQSDPVPDIFDLELSTIAMRRVRKVEYQLQVLFDRERIWFSVYYKNACLGSRSIPFDRE
ncbi:hypothetical protein LZL87_012939 [Fusarium oxysporum]|nr:hypothetical protein LZL87_012939 [Fusarium oxysporum]